LSMMGDSKFSTQNAEETSTSVIPGNDPESSCYKGDVLKRRVREELGGRLQAGLRRGCHKSDAFHHWTQLLEPPEIILF
jgi:hypothetical protein